MSREFTEDTQLDEKVERIVDTNLGDNIILEPLQGFAKENVPSFPPIVINNEYLLNVPKKPSPRMFQNMLRIAAPWVDAGMATSKEIIRKVFRYSVQTRIEFYKLYAVLLEKQFKEFEDNQQVKVSKVFLRLIKQAENYKILSSWKCRNSAREKLWDKGDRTSFTMFMRNYYGKKT